MNNLSMFKAVVGFVASAGAGKVVSNIVKATTPSDISKINKVLLAVGSFAIGGIVGDQASKYVGEQIDAVIGVYHNLVDAKKA